MNINTSPYAPAWRQALPLLIALIGWLLFWYWETASAMVAIWARSDTYAHAFIVPPITLWLIWRQRADIFAEKPQTTFLFAFPIGVTTVFWLLGELTAVNALTQFTLVATLVLSIMALLGKQVSKHIAFPLAFLFFSVPIGDFMLPKLMEWTAAFTVVALRGTGIPVYQEGLQFVIPSGNWSVVEACSGIRYIIASVTVGTLFAYLNYVSLRRRLAFIAVSIIVPVFANWLRAYIIVMLGHLSGNKLAAGVDHLIYGWVFFGIVIMLMFMIGARWSEEHSTRTDMPKSTGANKAPSGAKAWSAALVIALLAAIGPLAFMAINNTDQASAPVLSQLEAPATWQQAPAFASWQPAYANPSAEVHQAFVQNTKPVGLYIGYYRNQNYERKLVTSTNTLATSNDRVWSVLSQKLGKVQTVSLPAKIRISELLGKEGIPDTRLTVWHWYWINGKLTSSDIEAKLYTALSRLAGKGDDSAVIMMYAPVATASESLPAFANQAAGQINQLLQTTRNQR